MYKLKLPGVIGLLFLGSTLLLTLSCGGGPTHEVTERYVLVASNIKLPYWQSAAAGLYKAAAELKVKAEVVGPDTYDPKAQHEALQKVIREKPAGILVSPADPQLMRADIDSAIAQGIPVIAIDSDAAASKRLLFIGTDNYKAGVMGAGVAARKLQGKGNVVVFTMPEQANLNDRLRGYKDVFAASPQIKITEIVDIKGDARIAFDKTTEIFEKEPVKPDAFVCLEAIACPEVAEVLNRHKVTDKTVVAMDTHPRTLEWIRKGVITATIGQKPFTMAFFGLKMLGDLHLYKLPNLDAQFTQNSFSPLPTFVDTGATLIDNGNVAGFVKARQSAHAGE